MFLVQLLRSMTISVKLPVVECVDNVGAIFMTSNVTTTSQTKHIDIRQKYVNEHVEDGIVTIIFLKSAANDNDDLKKNLSGEFHEKHTEKMIGEKPNIVNLVRFKNKGRVSMIMFDY